MRLHHIVNLFLKMLQRLLLAANADLSIQEYFKYSLTGTCPSELMLLIVLHIEVAVWPCH